MTGPERMINAMSFSYLIFFALLGLSFSQTTFQPYGAHFQSPVTLAPNLSARVLFSNLTTPRGIDFDSSGNLLVVERGFGITAFHPAPNGTGTLRSVILQNPNFTQGIQVDGDRLYLSTASDALVYRYNASTRSVLDGGTVIVTGFPVGGGECYKCSTAEMNSATRRADNARSTYIP